MTLEEPLISIPAEPAPFAFPAGRIALVVIDMQRDFLEPGGFGDALGNDVHRLRPIIPTVARALAAFRAAGLPVVHTREGHRPDMSDCPPAKRLRGNPGLRIGDRGPMGRILVLGEPGNQIVPELSPLPGELVIDKPGKGAFHATDLDATLRARGVTHLAIAGVTTEVCVQTTMREANDRGYTCVLIEEGTESYFPEFKRATLEMVRAEGAIVGWTATADDLIGAVGRAVATSPRADATVPAPPSPDGSTTDLIGLRLAAHGLADPATQAALPWTPLRPGIEIARLYTVRDGGPSAALLRYAPGARLQRHEHVDLEHIYVLSGGQTDDGGAHPAGSLLVHGPGTSHQIASPSGCVVLAIWQRPVRFVGE